MSLCLKPYPATKDSAVSWLGEVPKHWGLRSLGSLTSPVNERGRPDLPLLSVVREKGVIPRATMSDDENRNFVPDDLSNYRVVRKGCLVINKMKAWQGSLGIAPCDGVVSPAYFVYDFRIENLFYGQALLRSRPYVGLFARASDGVRIGQWDLSISGMKRIPVIVPPRAEQAGIVRFLDHADKRIRRFIAAKGRLIELLNEQKQAIIHQAVTRGLDRNVQLKPSGIESLVEIPLHWQLRRLKSIAKIRYGLGQPPRETETGLPLIRATNIDHSRILEKGLVRVDPADVPEGRNAFLSEGEIIVVRSGALTADSAIIPKQYEGAVAGYDLIVTVRAARSDFVAMALLCPYVQADQLIIASMRAAQPHLNAEELGAAAILLPPDDEQARIVKFVEDKNVPLDEGIARAEREIALLREYRTRLIADVVTGKLDVRGVELRPLDEAEELPPVGDEALDEATEEETELEPVEEDGDADERDDRSLNSASPRSGRNHLAHGAAVGPRKDDIDFAMSPVRGDI